MQFPRDASFIWQFGWILAWIVSPFLCRLHVVGADNVPRDEGCVFACNHTMGPDFLLLACASPRQVYFMAKVEAFHIFPLLSLVLWMGGVFPVRRGGYDSAAIQKAVRIAESGRVLGMYPEGTRSRDGVLQAGKSGAARIAIQSGTPVVPVVIFNASGIFSRFWRQLRRPEAFVRFGKPIRWRGDAKDPGAAKQYTQEIMKGVAALLPAERRGPYGEAAESKDI